MKTTSNKYHGHRFPTEVISHGVWLYYRFSLSLRDVEELLAKRGITVTHETIRQWCRKFGPEYARKLKGRQGRLGEVWHLDEVFVKIGGERLYRWRAVDQDGDVIDILVQRYRNVRGPQHGTLSAPAPSLPLPVLLGPHQVDPLLDVILHLQV
jgi:putative transposase